MFLPKRLQRIFERKNLYFKFRYSKWIYALWLLLRPDVRKEIAAKRNFYKPVIPNDCKLIFDIGANEGIMTAIFSELSESVVAVEPSSRNINILSAKFTGNKNITIFPVAVSDATGEQTWYEDENDYAMGTLSHKWNDSKAGRADGSSTPVATTTLDDLIRQYGTPDFIKIDVEGNEWQALKGLSQPVPLLSFEAILPQFWDETVLCIEHLLLLSPSARFNYITGNRFAYQSYQTADVLFNDINAISETADIFCKA